MVIRSQQLSVWKYVAVAYNAIVARTVHRSLLAWLPAPSVTHVPPLVTWQYAEPLVTCHIARHTAPAPSDEPQFSLPHELAEHDDSWDSEPEHCTLSSQNELATLSCVGAEDAEPSPNWRQTTFASAISQRSSHTYRHEPE